MRKIASVYASQFDCLPGHYGCIAKAEASSARVAVTRAVQSVFNYAPLKRRRIHSFKMSVVVTDVKPTEEVSK